MFQDFSRAKIKCSWLIDLGKDFQGSSTFRLWYGYHCLLFARFILRVGGGNSEEKNKNLKTLNFEPKWTICKVEAKSVVIAGEISTIKKKWSVLCKDKKKEGTAVMVQGSWLLLLPLTPEYHALNMILFFHLCGMEELWGHGGFYP